MAKTALLLIDFQNDYFPDGKWVLEDIETAAANGAKLLAEFRHKGLPVVHVRHEFTMDDAPFFIPGSEGAWIHSSVAAQEGEPVVLKHTVNSFRDTNLQVILDGLKVDHLVVVGAMSHMCIDAGVRAAADFGYDVTVAQDACATRDQTFNGVTVQAKHVHAAFMAALEFAYARIVNTDELLAEIG